MVTKTKAPQPTQTEANAADAVTGSMTGQAAEVVSISEGKGTRKGIFDRIEVALTESGAEKHQRTSAVRQKLAEVADYAREGEAKKAELEQASADAAFLLYQLRSSGQAGAEEVSSLLGDSFGYVPKKDGTPGSTPAGMGGIIRRRVVRFYNAWEYVNNNGDDRFFIGLPKSDVAAILNEVNNGNASIWTGHDKLTKLRSSMTERPDPAFDSKHIRKLVDQLAKPEAVELIAGDEILAASYAALRKMLAVINNETAE